MSIGRMCRTPYRVKILEAGGHWRTVGAHADYFEAEHERRSIVCHAGMRTAVWFRGQPYRQDRDGDGNVLAEYWGAEALAEPKFVPALVQSRALVERDRERLAEWCGVAADEIARLSNRLAEGPSGMAALCEGQLRKAAAAPVGRVVPPSVEPKARRS